MLRRSVVLLAFCALVAGCGEDESAKYTARQVQESLRAHGVESAMLTESHRRADGTVVALLTTFSGTGLGEGVQEVLYDPRFDRRTGPAFQVTIFENERAARKWDPPWFDASAHSISRSVGLVRIRKGNVVADVWQRREAAVRRALDTLPRATKTFDGYEVAEALQGHGFAVAEPTGSLKALKEAFPQIIPPGVRSVVVGRKQLVRSAPAGQPPELVVAALIFNSEDEASCGESNAIGTCLRKWNVVVVVRANWAEAAREALEDLD